MDTKTKTREDEKTPAGETQVRERGDVLAENEPPRPKGRGIIRRKT